jgi:hypothetical protein
LFLCAAYESAIVSGYVSPTTGTSYASTGAYKDEAGNTIIGGLRSNPGASASGTTYPNPGAGIAAYGTYTGQGTMGYGTPSTYPNTGTPAYGTYPNTGTMGYPNTGTANYGARAYPNTGTAAYGAYPNTATAGYGYPNTGTMGNGYPAKVEVRVVPNQKSQMQQILPLIMMMEGGLGSSSGMDSMLPLLMMSGGLSGGSVSGKNGMDSMLPLLLLSGGLSGSGSSSDSLLPFLLMSGGMGSDSGSDMDSLLPLLLLSEDRTAHSKLEATDAEDKSLTNATGIDGDVVENRAASTGSSRKDLMMLMLMRKMQEVHTRAHAKLQHNNTDAGYYGEVPAKGTSAHLEAAPSLGRHSRHS